ncbi:hypothetical protein JB92DRAFT_912346 [Gautieria morchelliformis]|nr:hypothetical protein JB92DRAFT_912346 [Gautieria morchelliformis]
MMARITEVIDPEPNTIVLSTNPSALSAIHDRTHVWLVDSAASSHLCGNIDLFHELHTIPDISVDTASGDTFKADQRGTIHITIQSDSHSRFPGATPGCETVRAVSTQRSTACCICILPTMQGLTCSHKALPCTLSTPPKARPRTALWMVVKQARSSRSTRSTAVRTCSPEGISIRKCAARCMAGASRVRRTGRATARVAMRDVASLLNMWMSRLQQQQRRCKELWIGDGQGGGPWEASVREIIVIYRERDGCRLNDSWRAAEIWVRRLGS